MKLVKLEEYDQAPKLIRSTRFACELTACAVTGGIGKGLYGTYRAFEQGMSRPQLDTFIRIVEGLGGQLVLLLPSDPSEYEELKAGRRNLFDELIEQLKGGKDESNI